MRLFLICGCLLTLSRSLVAADPAPPVTLPHTEQREITSKIIGQRYELMVSLPADYATSNKTYPVLYVLDSWHFPFLAFLQVIDPWSKRVPPLIIVTIGYSADANEMILRMRDFAPNKDPKWPVSGHAAAYLAFFEKELIPFVESTYRVTPGDRGLLGHSLGGLFALYALEQRPALFQRIVAASPALGWDGSAFLKTAPALLKAESFHTRLDLSAGDAGDIAGGPAFAALLDQLKPAGLTYRFTLYHGENHNSVRTLSFPSGLSWIYRNE